MKMKIQGNREQMREMSLILVHLAFVGIQEEWGRRHKTAQATFKQGKSFSLRLIPLLTHLCLLLNSAQKTCSHIVLIVSNHCCAYRDCLGSARYA